MSGAGVVAPPLIYTGHPLQCAGARAIVVLAGRTTPEEVTHADLDVVAERLVADVCRAATADKDSYAYEWWKVLFALYPNSKATHSKRSRDRAVLEPAIAELFVMDDAQSTSWPCTFCGSAAATVWTKTLLPMFDTNRALNTLPPKLSGWPVCRGCRVAAWALPYGAWVTAGSATVFTCEDADAEQEFVERNVQQARQVQQLGFGGSGIPGARAELIAARALRAVPTGLAASILWSFKNDNQEPWLRVTHTRRAVPRFLSIVMGNADTRRGWQLLERELTRRDKDGRVTSNGADEAARLLFEAEDGPSRSLLQQLHFLLGDTSRSWSLEDRTALTRLAFTYAEEVLGMKSDLQPVATIIADWIEFGSGSPRGRLAEYRSVALSDYKLGALLMQAHFRLTLDGREVKVQPDDWKLLIERRPRAWEQRMLLTAHVLQELQKRGVVINDKAAKDDPRTEALLEQPVLGFEDDDEMGPP